MQPSYGLTDEQVEGMILESFDYAEEDFRQAPGDRSAQRGGDHSGRAGKGTQEIRLGSSLLRRSATNIGKLEAALKAVMQQDDYQAIRSAIDALNQATMRLAELMMDTAVPRR